MASKIRDRIVDQAICCFAAHGYSGCSTKEISSRADVTEGSLFRLFGSKQKLFEAAIERVKGKTLPADKFEKLLSTGDLETGIQRAFRGVYDHVSSDALRLNRYAMLESAELANATVRPVYASRIKPLAKRIRESGECRRNADAPFVAESLYLAVLNCQCEGMFLKRSRKKQNAVTAKFITLMLRGILK